jgi:hypothetical protein
VLQFIHAASSPSQVILPPFNLFLDQSANVTLYYFGQRHRMQVSFIESLDWKCSAGNGVLIRKITNTPHEPKGRRAVVVRYVLDRSGATHRWSDHNSRGAA